MGPGQWPWTISAVASVRPTTLADEGDLVRLNADREMSFATRSLLVERANRIADALERLQ